MGGLVVNTDAIVIGVLLTLYELHMLRTITLDIIYNRPEATINGSP